MILILRYNKFWSTVGYKQSFVILGGYITCTCRVYLDCIDTFELYIIQSIHKSIYIHIGYKYSGIVLSVLRFTTSDYPFGIFKFSSVEYCYLSPFGFLAPKEFVFTLFGVLNLWLWPYLVKVILETSTTFWYIRVYYSGYASTTSIHVYTCVL